MVFYNIYKLTLFLLECFFQITTNTLTKRPHGNEPLLSDSPKRLKPDLHRVTALTKQKAARRSVSNAIKISRSQAVRETSGLAKNNRSTLNSGDF